MLHFQAYFLKMHAALESSDVNNRHMSGKASKTSLERCYSRYGTANQNGNPMSGLLPLPCNSLAGNAL